MDLIPCGFQSRLHFFEKLKTKWVKYFFFYPELVNSQCGLPKESKITLGGF